MEICIEPEVPGVFQWPEKKKEKKYKKHQLINSNYLSGKQYITPLCSAGKRALKEYFVKRCEELVITLQNLHKLFPHSVSSHLSVNTPLAASSDLVVNNKLLLLLDSPDNISEASPHRFHLVRNPVFLTQCVDQRGHQVVVVARHRGKQTSETKGRGGVHQTWTTHFAASNMPRKMCFKWLYSSVQCLTGVCKTAKSELSDRTKTSSHSVKRSLQKFTFALKNSQKLLFYFFLKFNHLTLI